MTEMLKDKKCPRCKGFVITDRDPNGWYEQCIQCGYHRDIETYELRELMTAKKVKSENGKRGKLAQFSKALTVISILVIASLVAGCSSSTSTASPATSTGKDTISSNQTVQSNSAGSVTINAEWYTDGSDSLVFDIVIDTHSVDLDRYDLKALSLLRDDRGNAYQPVSWQSAPGGHHRSGKLTFTTPPSLSKGNARFIELLIRDVSGVKERVLRWEL